MKVTIFKMENFKEKLKEELRKAEIINEAKKQEREQRNKKIIFTIRT